MDDFERKWKIIRERLSAEATGADPRPFSSGRTLFGIKSEAERKMERFAREIEEEQLRALREGAQSRAGEQDENDGRAEGSGQAGGGRQAGGGGRAEGNGESDDDGSLQRDSLDRPSA